MRAGTDRNARSLLISPTLEPQRHSQIDCIEVETERHLFYESSRSRLLRDLLPLLDTQVKWFHIYSPEGCLNGIRSRPGFQDRSNSLVCITILPTPRIQKDRSAVIFQQRHPPSLAFHDRYMIRRPLKTRPSANVVSVALGIHLPSFISFTHHSRFLRVSSEALDSIFIVSMDSKEPQSEIRSSSRFAAGVHESPSLLSRIHSKDYADAWLTRVQEAGKPCGFRMREAEQQRKQHLPRNRVGRWVWRQAPTGRSSTVANIRVNRQERKLDTL